MSKAKKSTKVKEQLTQKISKVKWRPMLYRVGKKPLEVVQEYPAQLVEAYNTKDYVEKPSFENLSKNWKNLVFQGDNKEVLSTLLVNGFRGKIDLIYIDPPFDSWADYVRKVELRWVKEKKMEWESQNLIEQIQYIDIRLNDNYLQFMYERLLLLRELLSDKWSIYLHCDRHKSHYLRFLLDEVFGGENFVNEIIWSYRRWTVEWKSFQSMHDNIFLYAKNVEKMIFNNQYESFSEKTQVAQYERMVVNWRAVQNKDKKLDRKTEKWVAMRDVWEISYLHPVALDRTWYPTQKPEELLERIIKTSSDKDSIVLDCFWWAGTTQAVAQKFDLKWISCDINKWSIQTTNKRIQKIINEPQKKKGKKVLSIGGKLYNSFLHYRVNNYDFQEQNELMRIIFEKYGIEKSKTDSFFDWIQWDTLVKIIDFNKPFTKVDIQSIKNELIGRKKEERNVLVICSGSELWIDEELMQHNKISPINKIVYKDIQKDGIIVFESAQSDVNIKKDWKKVHIKIKDYISPTILKRLEIDRSIFNEQVWDFRSQIDVVLVDTNYDWKVFNVCYSDVPEKKSDFVKGEYELDIKNKSSKIAVKIIDMLWEEILILW